MRKKLLLGNWKMNKSCTEAKEFIDSASDFVKIAADHHIDVGVAPAFTSLCSVIKRGPKGLIVAAQNVHYEDRGAFTGEVSIPMLLDLGVQWVIIGHSERRLYDNETSEKCHKKIIALLSHDMIPVYCVGESLAQFESGATKKVVGEQMRIGLADVDPKEASHLVIAYEPVWSIGTGKNASQAIAQEICSFIRKILHELFGDVSEEIRILYGGSVKPENVKEYLLSPDIDGALIGGASLKVDTFAALIKNSI